MFSLEGKVALVTGAAYGIGFAMAEALYNAGAKIAFNCRSQHHMDQALADYKAKGIEAHGYICDVTDEEQVKAMVADINKELGVIDILVNNAGIIKRIPMTEMSVEDFRQVVDIDLNAPFIVSKAVIPGMKEKGHGKIINICSMMSELGRETVSAYAAAKGGLKMLTRNICSEFGEYNIQCNGIGPGYIATPQTAPLRERQADGSRHPFDSFIVAKTPAARLAFPIDYFDNVICYNGEQTKLRYNVKGDYRSYQADAFQGWGQYDLAVKLPPVPSGLYEFRLFYSPMGHGGMMQFYWGTSKNVQEMTALSIPLDVRIMQNDPRIGWSAFYEEDDQGVSTDEAMKNRGYMRGPFSFCGHPGDDGDQKTTKNCRGDGVVTLRRVLGRVNVKQSEDFWFRFKNVINDDSDLKWQLDFVEFVPVNVVDNNMYSEDWY